MRPCLAGLWLVERFSLKKSGIPCSVAAIMKKFIKLNPEPLSESDSENKKPGRRESWLDA